MDSVLGDARVSRDKNEMTSHKSFFQDRISDKIKLYSEMDFKIWQSEREIPINVQSLNSRPVDFASQL